MSYERIKLGNTVTLTSVTGSLQGTSSFALLAATASWATTASYALLSSTSSYSITSSYGLTSSYALTASYALNGGSGGGTGNVPTPTTASTYLVYQDGVMKWIPIASALAILTAGQFVLYVDGDNISTSTTSVTFPTLVYTDTDNTPSFDANSTNVSTISISPTIVYTTSDTVPILDNNAANILSAPFNVGLVSNASTERNEKAIVTVPFALGLIASGWTSGSI